MKILAEIPDTVAIAIANGKGRRELSIQFNIPEWEARYYYKLFHNHIKPSGKVVLVLPDLHVPYHDKNALNIAIGYGKAVNPDIVLLQGDLVDFYQVSSWLKDPKKRDFAWEIEQCIEVIDHITNNFPNAKKVLLEGNHEHRLLRFLWQKASQLCGLKAMDVGELLKLQDRGWEYVINRERLMAGEDVFKVGKLRFIHGHEVRTGWGAVNLARMYYMKTTVNIVVAHHHQTQEYLTRKLNNQHEGAWVLGGLCDLSPDYLPSNNWNHGFAIVRFDSDGDFAIENKKIINGKIL